MAGARVLIVKERIQIWATGWEGATVSCQKAGSTCSMNKEYWK
ncbi:MAG: hypothetical protein V8S98_10595 [Lachnospiraceae bacterium]